MKSVMTDSPGPAYDQVADVYGRVLDPDGLGLADPVLIELLGDIHGQVVLSLACGQGQDAGCLPASAQA